MAQSLIEQLQFGAVDGSTPITDLLRKAKLAAVKLNTADFAEWVNAEINGYTGQLQVPAYRSVRCSLKFLNPYHGWQPVFGSDNIERGVRQPVGELMELSKVGSGYLTMNVPEELRESISQQIGFQCDVRLHVNTVSISGVVEAVRNHILEWTLKLEKAGIQGQGLTFTAAEARAAQNMTVTNNYHGPVASIAQGSNTIGEITQTNNSVTPQQLRDVIVEITSLLPTGLNLSKPTTAALSELATSEAELQNGRVPFARLTKAVGFLQKADDLATRAPGAIARLRDLAQMLGLV